MSRVAAVKEQECVYRDLLYNEIRLRLAMKAKSFSSENVTYITVLGPFELEIPRTLQGKYIVSSVA